jgi:hypothetical protein
MMVDHFLGFPEIEIFRFGFWDFLTQPVFMASTGNPNGLQIGRTDGYNWLTFSTNLKKYQKNQLNFF